MSKSSVGWNGEDLAMNIRRFRDFEVTWAGPGRMSGEFCLGSEDGRIIMTADDLTQPMALKESPVPSGEAINGVAFLNNLIVLSTRSEVVFMSQQPVGGKGF